MEKTTVMPKWYLLYDVIALFNEDDQWFVFEKFFHIGHTQKVSPSCVFPDEIPNLSSV